MGGSRRINFGPFEYPAGADIIFDFGNPNCTVGWGSHKVYNVGSQNITGSLVAFNNPSPVYPVLNSGAGSSGGSMAVQYITGINQGSYLTWDYISTANQTSVVIYAPNGSQVSGEQDYSPLAGTGTSYIEMKTTRSNYAISIGGNGIQSNFTNVIDTSAGNGRNTWNMIGATANSTNQQYAYINDANPSGANVSLNRTNDSTQTYTFGSRSNLRYMAYLQYPKVLTKNQMYQIYKVFSQRFFT